MNERIIYTLWSCGHAGMRRLDPAQADVETAMTLAASLAKNFNVAIHVDEATYQGDTLIYNLPYARFNATGECTWRNE